MKKMNLFMAIAFTGLLISCSIDSGCEECYVECQECEIEEPPTVNRPDCQKEVVTDHNINFENEGYNGVSIVTDRGYNNELTVLPETSDFGSGEPKFGADPENMVGTIADENGNFVSGGGTVTLTFDFPTEVVSIDFLDSDFSEDNVIEVYVENGDNKEIPVLKVSTEHSRQTMYIGQDNVESIKVVSKESFAIDNITYRTTETVNECN